MGAFLSQTAQVIATVYKSGSLTAIYIERVAIVPKYVNNTDINSAEVFRR
jgi:hypothetical protein